ncbi:hypothetical protein GQ53DRAFT_765837 [Thozetella sp. PMI_491]|nr:hypothetical protein GQ53DRAFT_765837 [Thozetella sp. PMI_491]
MYHKLTAVFSLVMSAYAVAPPQFSQIMGDLQPRIDDPCATPGYDAVTRFDCMQKPGHVLNPDGTCGSLTTAVHCEMYCEVRRTYFLGIENRAPDKYGDSHPPGITVSLQEGEETSITYGFGIGVDGTFKDVVGAGVTFEYSVTQSKSKTIAIEAEPSDKYYSRWVFWPKMLETCGSVSKLNYIDIPVCRRGGQGSNPEVMGGESLVMWALRYEDEHGFPVPLDEQTPSYRAVCTQNKGYGGVNVCSTPSSKLAQHVAFQVRKEDPYQS